MQGIYVGLVKFVHLTHSNIISQRVSYITPNITRISLMKQPQSRITRSRYLLILVCLCLLLQTSSFSNVRYIQLIYRIVGRGNKAN